MRAYFKEIPFDQFTPITAYYALQQKGSCILESSPGSGRFSFVGIDPIAKIQGENDFSNALRNMMKEHPVEVDHPTPLFTGAPVGYITFENAYFFQIYRSAVIFDHENGNAYLSTIGDESELERLHEKLNQPKLLPTIDLKFGPVETNLSDEEFSSMVLEAQEHMKKGDVYQIVISRKFQSQFKGSPFQLYRAVRQKSPAPYLFFFDLEGESIIGASPEKIISIQDGMIESVPIAGTTKNGEDVEAFLKDTKESAEHVMLVDLARNDVGSVALPGSVVVKEFKKVQKFAHITHIISKIEGKLDPKFDAIDALEASFPAGTLSGAPKKRARELICEIEKEKRGLYGGAIVALSVNGDLSTCIAIRTAIIKDEVLTVQAGGGLVLDSIAQKEADESRLKASTILKVVSCS